MGWYNYQKLFCGIRLPPEVTFPLVIDDTGLSDLSNDGVEFETLLVFIGFHGHMYISDKRRDIPEDNYAGRIIPDMNKLSSRMEKILTPHGLWNKDWFDVWFESEWVT
jgi:hypothetical protein